MVAMVEPLTARQIIKKLESEGYTDGLRATEDGLFAMEKKLVIAPENIIVDKIFRLEGETNLDDEEIIFAVRCKKTPIKGTYHVAFGPKIDGLDADMVLRLKNLRAQ